ncbi:sulfotransferase domain-containing protein [Psychroflexus sp. CAK8W]|uniref:Sulfotransferase domain-containing protein n=1 Tax=Psychroflexus longus TaxID=2873596 RepID=A0ABS7XM25_9FLAO|nr:sulfotransferase [Psychroflexus longus]MBZ9779449.1 sulfotransferase domain-containing protein [Psychroflexus longus]
MKVDIFIVGGQKCGTTALHSFLSEHHQIKAGKQKEIDFFSYDAQYKKGFDYYHSFFKLNLYEKYIEKIKLVDASPSYLADNKTHTTADRIVKYNRNANIIILVRNPIKRAFSAYMMYKNRYYGGREGWWFDWIKKRGGNPEDVVKRNIEDYRSFDVFIENELKAIEQNKSIECSVLKQGLYSNYIEVYKQYFKKVLVISNESLNKETDNTLKKLMKELSLKPFKKEFENHKVFKGKYDEEISEQTFSILNKFYFSSNKDLNNKFGINYTNT